MKNLLAAATFATILLAVPAGAQTAYGADVSGTPTVGTFEFGGGSWKDNFQIYGSANTAQFASSGASQADRAPDFIQVLIDGDPNLTLYNTDPAAAALLSGGIPTNAVAVPEPATWAMMLMGFGAVGVALRSRRKATLRFA